MAKRTPVALENINKPITRGEKRQTISLSRNNRIFHSFISAHLHHLFPTGDCSKLKNVFLWVFVNICIGLILIGVKTKLWKRGRHIMNKVVYENLRNIRKFPLGLYYR